MATGGAGSPCPCESGAAGGQQPQTNMTSEGLISAYVVHFHLRMNSSTDEDMAAENFSPLEIQLLRFLNESENVILQNRAVRNRIVTISRQLARMGTTGDAKDDALDYYTSALTEFISEGITWSGILQIFMTFVNINRDSTVPLCEDLGAAAWTLEYFQNILDPWIASNGGWAALVRSGLTPVDVLGNDFANQSAVSTDDEIFAELGGKRTGRNPLIEGTMRPPRSAPGHADTPSPVNFNVPDILSPYSTSFIDPSIEWESPEPLDANIPAMPATAMYSSSRMQSSPTSVGSGQCANFPISPISGAHGSSLPPSSPASGRNPVLSASPQLQGRSSYRSPVRHLSPQGRGESSRRSPVRYPSPQGRGQPAGISISPIQCVGGVCAGSAGRGSSPLRYDHSGRSHLPASAPVPRSRSTPPCYESSRLSPMNISRTTPSSPSSCSPADVAQLPRIYGASDLGQTPDGAVLRFYQERAEQAAGKQGSTPIGQTPLMRRADPAEQVRRNLFQPNPAPPQTGNYTFSEPSDPRAQASGISTPRQQLHFSSSAAYDCSGIDDSPDYDAQLDLLSVSSPVRSARVEDNMFPYSNSSPSHFSGNSPVRASSPSPTCPRSPRCKSPRRK